MAKQRPLCASSRSAWIKTDRTIHRYELRMMELFMRGCPCPGVSARHVTIQSFENVDNERCACQIVELESAGVKIEAVRDSSALAKRLIAEKRSGAGFPAGRRQFVMYTISGNSILQKYGLFQDRKASEIRPGDAAGYRGLLKLDGFFRHLRNSIA